MKVAIVATSDYEVIEFRNLLYNKYTITKAEETSNANMCQGVYSLQPNDWSSILKMFSMIKAMTGINPYTQKCKRVGKTAKIIASVILRDRYGLKYQKIAEILGYKSHASPFVLVGNIKIENIKTLPIELVIMQIKRQINNPIVIISDSQVQ